jgi:predicted RNase H-like HicB family nuclease
MKYAIIIEKGARNYSAYVPDLPGCVATGETEEAVIRLLREAIRLHIEGLHEDGEPVPEPISSTAYVTV